MVSLCYSIARLPRPYYVVFVQRSPHQPTVSCNCHSVSGRKSCGPTCGQGSEVDRCPSHLAEMRATGADGLLVYDETI